MYLVIMELHYIQIELINKISTKPYATFNSLLIENIDSDHMNYHLKRLIKLKLVEKDRNTYALTDTGKNYVGLIDDTAKAIEKQPKTSVLIQAVRKNPQTGEIENLMSKRLKHPYYGKVGKLTGKVRFGETLLAAAQRELLEETGLTAKVWELEGIYHKLRYKKDDMYVQDTLFYLFFVTDFNGEFIKKTEFQENIWVTKAMIENKNFDFFEDVSHVSRIKPKKFNFKEDVREVIGY